MSIQAPGREEAARALDRIRVARARMGRSWLRLLWLLVGPGILVMLGENDGPSMLSYSATGSQYGIGFFLPFVVLTFALAFVAQEITVRLGAVSKAGHAELIYRRFGRFWGNFAMIDLLFTNVLTLITEFVAIVAGASYFGISKYIAVSAAFLVVTLALSARRYWSWERVTLLLALGNLVFVPVALLSHPNWSAVGHAFLTWSPLPNGGLNEQTIIILLSDIGATITPWMLFFQQGAVSDKGLSTRDIRMGRIDTAIGALLATVAATACILATAPLYTHHMNASQYGAAQFAQALVPYVGHVGGTLFALGILEAGLVAIVAISTSSAYAFGEVTQKAHSLNRTFREAKGFYLVLLLVAGLSGSVVLIPGFPLEFVVLIVNVLAVLTMPPAIGFLLLLVNDKEIMGEHRSGWLLNTLGIGVGAFVSLAGILYALTVIFPTLHF
ncbi:NRAMP family divalent metal transporter [Sulfoacidibacillus thermotolerans]|nr:divalent metal cation transporter [Sulfoacidibacillus thermotolerans]